MRNLALQLAELHRERLVQLGPLLPDFLEDLVELRQVLPALLTTQLWSHHLTTFVLAGFYASNGRLTGDRYIYSSTTMSSKAPLNLVSFSIQFEPS